MSLKNGIGLTQFKKPSECIVNPGAFLLKKYPKKKGLTKIEVTPSIQINPRKEAHNNLFLLFAH